MWNFLKMHCFRTFQIRCFLLIRKLVKQLHNKLQTSQYHVDYWLMTVCKTSRAWLNGWSGGHANTQTHRKWFRKFRKKFVLICDNRPVARTKILRGQSCRRIVVGWLRACDNHLTGILWSGQLILLKSFIHRLARKLSAQMKKITISISQ